MAIWRQFNNFVIRLDRRPDNWEDKVNLFIGYKIEQGMKSTSVKSYVSDIKRTLIDDGYPWADQKLLAKSLTRACRLINDRVQIRLPIQCSLLEMILFEVQRIFNHNGQQYIQILYQTLFAISYYGMMRVGEVTFSDHVVKAKDVQAARNKDKLKNKLKLYTSKTHHRGMLIIVLLFLLTTSKCFVCTFYNHPVTYKMHWIKNCESPEYMLNSKINVSFQA